MYLKKYNLKNKIALVTGAGKGIGRALALKLSEYQKELQKNIKYFIQVNLADEKHKSGISLTELNHFYNFCIKKLSLKIIG